MAGKSGRGHGRDMKVRVKTAKGRTISSTRWLQRQLNDPYVKEAQRRGFRSRAAFKLLEIDDKVRFLKAGGRVVDLGAAPGGWTQVAVERCGPTGRVLAVDIQEMDPIAGAQLLTMDFRDDDAPARLMAALDGQADAVISDMAAPATGHPQTDHLRIMHLCELALDFATQVLAPDGTFIAKVFQGGAEHTLLAELKRLFRSVRHIKPPASRKESAETYVVATGYRGSAGG